MQRLKQKIIGAYEALKKGIFIITSCLIIFVALRNSLMWHLQEVWGASASLWYSMWALFYEAFGRDLFYLYVVGSFVVTLTAFIIGNLFFVIIDLTGKPAAILKYKIQEEKHIPINWEKYKKALKLCSFNALVVGILFNLVTYPIVKWRGCGYDYELPSFATTVWHSFCFIVTEEIGFYYFHRLLHHPKLYRHIHKIHHEWTAPTGIISIYAHPIEHVLSNMLPVWLGPIFMGSHLSVTWLWYIMSVVTTTISHSGYHLPFFPSPEAHDYHHLKFNQMYGVMGVLDRLHGTDELFRQTKNNERHIMLLGLTPAKKMYPDSSKEEGKCCR